MFKHLRYSLLTLLLAVSTGAWAQVTWVKTSPSNLATGDVVVIVDQTSSTAMSNDKGTQNPPVATAVTLSTNKSEIESDVDATIQWTVTVDDGSYQFSPDGENYLYCTATNNGVRVGSSDNNAFTIFDNDGVDYLLNTATTRYIGVYNSQDWRCYTSINANIKNCVTAFYKKTVSSDTRTAIAENIKFEPTSVTVGEDGFYTLTADYAENATYSFKIESSDEDMFTAFYRGDHIGEYVVGYETGTVEVTVTITPNDTNTYKPVSKTFTVTVMAAPLEDIAALAAETTATATEFNVVFDNAVVTYVNGNNVYIQDESGAILYYKNGHGLTAGQILNGTATVTSALRNNNPQITALSGVTSTEGSAPLPTEVAAEDWDTPINTVLSQYFKVTGATITKNNNKYYVQLGDENVQLYGQGGSSGASGFSLDDLETTYTIVGFPTMYNTTPELVIYEVPENENALEDPQLSYPEESVTVIYGEEYELPELGNPHELEVEFLSSDEDVAVVDEAGNVTLTGNEGSTTIKAIFSGNEVFESGEASYTLIVKLPAPVRAFQKVTATEDITDGNYLIVYQGPKSGQDATEVSVAFNGGLESLDAANNNVPVTIVDDVIVTDEDFYFTIDTSDYSLLSASGIYIGRTSNSNGMQTSASSPFSHVITIDEDGNAEILADFDGSTTVLHYNYGANDQRFRYYRNYGQRAVQLYKEIDVPSTVELTIGQRKAAAVSSQYPLDFSNTNVKAYIITGKEGTTFTRQEVTTVPANTGIVITGEEGTYQIPVAAEADDIEGNWLVATTSGEYTVTDEDYGTVYGLFYSTKQQKVGFQKKPAGFVFGANKCFLRMPDASSANEIFFDFDTTAISGIATDVDNTADAYNVNGQKVNASYKGVVIRGGKKFIQK